MSIVDLLSSLDSLAKVINKKNHEVDALKKELEQKLTLVNLYLLGLHQYDIEENDILLTQLQNTIHCPNCDCKVWDNKTLDFILIPKANLKKKEKEEEQDIPDMAISKLNIDKQPSRKHGKISCSYCKELGHTRAKCPVKLATPKKEK